METRWLEWKAIIDTRWLCGGARCCKSETAPASCKFCKCLKCCKSEVRVSESELQIGEGGSCGGRADCHKADCHKAGWLIVIDCALEEPALVHCSDAVCAFCAHVPTLHCPTVTGDNATSIGGGLASKHQNIFLFKSAPERWDTGIVRPICLDRAQILSHNALAHNARGSISHGVCLHIALCPSSHHCCGRKRCTNLVSTLSQSHLSSQVLRKAGLRKTWQKLQH